MAKLDTTIENIELKTNKVIGNIPTADWTDDQYPSAKTLYNTYNQLVDLMYPIDSILITSTNIDPSDTVGGKWEPVDKSAKDAWIPLPTTAWTVSNAELGISGNAVSGLTLSHHTAQFKLQLSVNSAAALSDTEVILGVLNPAVCGLKAFPYSINDNVAIADFGDITLSWKLSSDGTISITDIFNAEDGSHSISSGSSFWLNFTYVVKASDLLDSFCDKFYWKRIA